MALIELDLTAQPDAPPGSPPPAYRLRLPGLVVAVLLAIALGGAAPVTPMLWRYLGVLPVPGGPEAPFQLAGGRVYTVTAAGTDWVTTAWAMREPPRKLWTARFPARVVGPDDVGFGGVEARQAGDVVLLSDGPATTAVDPRTGRIRWRSAVGVDRLAGGRIGVTQTQTFRPGTVYDQDSGAPGLLYFSSTGEPHVEPPLRTEIRGVDLNTGATLWTVPVPGSVNVFPAPGDAAAVLVLTSERIERLAGGTGAVVRAVALPKVGGTGPANGELSDGLVRVRYGDYSFAGHEVAYAADSLARRWQRDVPEVLLDPPNCGTVLCAGPRAALDVIDPVTGQVAWRAPPDVDLSRQGRYLVETDSGTGAPVRLVDPATGAVRVRLDGWRADISGGLDQPLVLRRAEPAGRSAFGVVLADRDAVQLLGETGGPVSDCTADRAHVVCRGGPGLQIWAYRA